MLTKDIQGAGPVPVNYTIAFGCYIRYRAFTVFCMQSGMGYGPQAEQL